MRCGQWPKVHLQSVPDEKRPRCTSTVGAPSWWWWRPTTGPQESTERASECRCLRLRATVPPQGDPTWMCIVGPNHIITYSWLLLYIYILYIYTNKYCIHIYCTYTVYILYIYCIYTVYILCIYCIYTVYILYIYCIYIYTVYIYIYRVYIYICTVYIYYIYIRRPRQTQGGAHRGREVVNTTATTTRRRRRRRRRTSTSTKMRQKDVW